MTRTAGEQAQQPPAHPLRCETCCNYASPDCPHEKVEIAYNYAIGVFAGHAIQRERIWDITAVVGCASHTSAPAQQQRIEQVIKELETRAGTLRSAAMEFSDYMRSARAAGIEEAIALLRGEEK